MPKQPGVNVVQDQTSDKGTATTAAENAQKQAEIKSDYTKQAEENKRKQRKLIKTK